MCYDFAIYKVIALKIENVFILICTEYFKIFLHKTKLIF